MRLVMDLAATCGGEHGTNGCHLAILSENIAFAHPIGVLVALATLSITTGNSASYPVYSRHSELP